MFKPLALYVGCCYTRAKKRNHFIAFISVISILGIALGVTVLITVLSVINGFDQQIRNRLLVMVPQVTVSSWQGSIGNWQPLREQLLRKTHINAIAPFVEGQAMLTFQGRPKFLIVKGIDLKYETTISPIGHKLLKGKLSALKPGKFGIILGVSEAKALGAHVGDKVTLLVPKTSLTPLGTLPRLKQFTVVGIFKVGYQFDDYYALINMQDAQKLYMLGNHVAGLQLKLSDLFLARPIADELNHTLPPVYRSFDWTQQNPNFFKALSMEKTMMFLILALIIAVAAFNMLSSLVMLVTDKQADIAILRTLGVQTLTMISIFVIQGAITGLIGTLVGVVGGVILSLNVTALANWLQGLLGVQFLNANVYYIDFLASHLQWSDVWHVASIAFLLSLLATLYPAWKAGRVQPAEALRYE